MVSPFNSFFDRGPSCGFFCQRTDPRRETRVIVSGSLYWVAKSRQFFISCGYIDVVKLCSIRWNEVTERSRVTVVKNLLVELIDMIKWLDGPPRLQVLFVSVASTIPVSTSCTVCVTLPVSVYIALVVSPDPFPRLRSARVRRLSRGGDLSFGWRRDADELQMLGWDRPFMM